MCSQYYNNTNPPSVIARATKPQPYWLISAAEAFPANGAGVWVLPAPGLTKELLDNLPTPSTGLQRT